ncbi:transmembrane protein 186 [Patella vulgata]|uniref:transmembrane protein 186 n=1 Tax=Patella vulgata TaxID=6465 RepID=UPI00217F3A4E|nr:transmembrane protein 186 [Patella vulgata]
MNYRNGTRLLYQVSAVLQKINRPSFPSTVLNYCGNVFMCRNLYTLQNRSKRFLSTCFNHGVLLKLTSHEVLNCLPLLICTEHNSYTGCSFGRYDYKQQQLGSHLITKTARGNRCFHTSNQRHATFIHTEHNVYACFSRRSEYKQFGPGLLTKTAIGKRSFHTSHLLCLNSELEKEYMSIYRLKNMKYLQILNRSKIYLTVSSMISLLPTIYNGVYGNVSPVLFLSLSAVITCITVALYILSALMPRIVGELGINKNSDEIRLSYLSFWGKRQDLLIPVNMLVPFAEIVESSKKDYVVIKLRDMSDKWYLFPQYAKLLEKSKIESVLGKIEK